MVNLKF